MLDLDPLLTRSEAAIIEARQLRYELERLSASCQLHVEAARRLRREIARTRVAVQRWQPYARSAPMP